MLFFHSEVSATMMHEHVEFLEASFIEEQSDSLTRGELSFLVLRIDSFLSAAHHGFGSALYQILDIILLDTHVLFIY